MTNSGTSGLFVENDARVTLNVNNTSTGNGTCTACTDAKAGLAVLAGSQVETIDDNGLDSNTVGVEISGTSTVTTLTNSSIVSNDNGGILIRESSEVTAFDNNTVRANRGIAAILVMTSIGTFSNSSITGNRTTGVRIFTGLNAQNEGRIECQGHNTLSGNTGGNILAVFRDARSYPCACPRAFVPSHCGAFPDPVMGEIVVSRHRGRAGPFTAKNAPLEMARRSLPLRGFSCVDHPQP